MPRQNIESGTAEMPECEKGERREKGAERREEKRREEKRREEKRRGEEDSEIPQEVLQEMSSSCSSPMRLLIASIATSRLL
ncbi:hypothetical protein GRJ2_000574200 [Grus japonensis]|uniref:Uncharacterized protein n=1 Tax=Grus japonensis TaxID=30415 RepID=A0ABC9W8I2_GRUJA